MRTVCGSGSRILRVGPSILTAAVPSGDRTCMMLLVLMDVGGKEPGETTISLACLSLPAPWCPSSVPGGALQGTWGSVPFALEDLSARGTPRCVLGHLGYHTVIGRSLYFATPTTCLCHSAPLLLCLLPLIICIRFSDYLLSRSCIFLPDVVSPSAHPLPLIKDSLRDFSLLTGG